MTRKLLGLGALLALLLVIGLLPASSQSMGEAVPTIVVRSVTQAERPIEYETTRLVVENMRELGLDVEHRAVPWAQLIDEVWYTRTGDDAWEMTYWRMVGRPERSDPDEFTYNLFHSSVRDGGYNFIGYNNPDYDSLAEAQRVEVADKEARLDIICEAQQIIRNDMVNAYFVHPLTPQVVNTQVFNPDSVVTQAGIGVHNFWTWIGIEPTGDETTLTTSTTSFLNSFNPLEIAGDAPSRVTEMTWDRLMRINPIGVAEPWAAEKVTWEDPLNVVVTLREGMTWHDGEPVTAEDAAYTFEAALAGTTQTDEDGNESFRAEAPDYYPFARNVANIEIIDDLNVRYTLHTPSAAFETSSLAKLNLIPEHVWRPIIEDLLTKDDADVDSIQEEIPIGSGPFKYVAFDVNEFVLLEAFDDHWARPKIDAWLMNVLPNQEATLGQIQSGEMNFLWEWPGDPGVLQDIVDSNEQLDLFSAISIGFQYFAFNVRYEPFDDVNFRQAVAHVIPQQFIIDNIYNGFAAPADSFVSAALEYWRQCEDLPSYDYTIEGARQLLADAGYSWGDDGRLHYPGG
ncbi:MAG: twin-arginine translocation pathway signal protein [Chloroflexi bacterium]|nr:twin-arginine translocation pathway signal protein [Chloroflexota bacterium]MYA92360.1 twin-arginine translocation pathway signal protein [Chloroflexota bacterium]MYC56421.1 twin-arginine translocation pathway signal protein [Chloroflexota bacterium]MYD38525.1 twin-arginine translocation pathway signal protein [Chloroflexota bacterium]MYH64858.1 twin-arginine translocation pathway signal protein [Chloroflexota bacterium]